MTRAIYTGHEVLTFQDYADMDTGKTLTAQPGVTYDVAPASGRLVPDLPAGWFVPEDPEAWAAKQEAERAEAERLAAESAAAEPGEQQEQETGPDGAENPDEQQQQDGGEPQQF